MTVLADINADDNGLWTILLVLLILCAVVWLIKQIRG